MWKSQDLNGLVIRKNAKSKSIVKEFNPWYTFAVGSIENPVVNSAMVTIQLHLIAQTVDICYTKCSKQNTFFQGWMSSEFGTKICIHMGNPKGLVE